MNKYNKCEGCKLWNGHHCTGARSYEPNADEHRAICNEHMAKQFWVVSKQLYNSEARVKELEEKLKWYDHYKNSALELKEKYNHLVDVNKTLEQKLQIAEEALKYYANSTMGEEYKKGKFRYLVKRSIDVGTGADYYLEYDATIAKQALQKIKGTKQCKNCKHYYTDYDCLNDFCDVKKKEISLNNVCDKWEE